MIVTITLGSQTGTQGSVRGWSGGTWEGGTPRNEARFVSPSHTHTHIHMHMLELANSKALRAPNIVIMTGWPWKINRFISFLFLSLSALLPLCLSTPLFMVVTLCMSPSPCSVHLHSSLPPAPLYFSNFLSVSPTEPRGGLGENGAVIKLIHSR